MGAGEEGRVVEEVVERRSVGKQVVTVGPCDTAEG